MPACSPERDASTARGQYGGILFYFGKFKSGPDLNQVQPPLWSPVHGAARIDLAAHSLAERSTPFLETVSLSIKMQTFIQNVSDHLLGGKKPVVIFSKGKSLTSSMGCASRDPNQQ